MLEFALGTAFGIAASAFVAWIFLREYERDPPKARDPQKAEFYRQLYAAIHKRDSDAQGT